MIKIVCFYAPHVVRVYWKHAAGAGGLQ